MNDLNSGEKQIGGCCSEGAPTPCCQPADRRASTCCNPEDGSWRKIKLLISVIIIIAAIGVGTHSFFSGNSAQSYTTVPAKSFSAGLTEVPAATADSGRSQNKPEEISLDRVLDSLQSLDVLAADKDVVFLILAGDVQAHSLAIPKQVRAVANNLANSGQGIAVFTVKNGAPDYERLVKHFSVNKFPSVVILGRQGSASALTDDISEARLYNAFVLASKSASCCPATGNASCCSPQSNAAPCCPK